VFDDYMSHKLVAVDSPDHGAWFAGNVHCPVEIQARKGSSTFLVRITRMLHASAPTFEILSPRVPGGMAAFYVIISTSTD
jgi:hypothetical protein